MEKVYKDVLGGWFFLFFSFLFGVWEGTDAFLFFWGGGGNRDAGTEVREFDQKT